MRSPTAPQKIVSPHQHTVFVMITNRSTHNTSLYTQNFYFSITCARDVPLPFHRHHPRPRLSGAWSGLPWIGWVPRRAFYVCLLPQRHGCGRAAGDVLRRGVMSNHTAATMLRESNAETAGNANYSQRSALSDEAPHPPWRTMTMADHDA